MARLRINQVLNLTLDASTTDFIIKSLAGPNNANLLLNARNYGMELRIDEDNSGHENFRVTKGPNGSTTLLTVRNNGNLEALGEISGRYDHTNRFVLQSFLTSTFISNANPHYLVDINIYVPSDKSLYLRRVRWKLGNLELLPRIFVTGGAMWTGSSEVGDVLLDLNLISGNNTNRNLNIVIYNSLNSSYSALGSGFGVWAEFEIR